MVESLRSGKSKVLSEPWRISCTTNSTHAAQVFDYYASYLVITKGSKQLLRPSSSTSTILHSMPYPTHGDQSRFTRISSSTQRASASVAISGLSRPPSSRLENLKEKRKGPCTQHSGFGSTRYTSSSLHSARRTIKFRG